MVTRGQCGLAGVAGILSTLAGTALGQTPKITDLGAISGDTRAFAVSPDGHVVVGQTGAQGFVWSAATGIIALGGGAATGASANGSVISGYSGSITGTGQQLHSVRWTAWSPDAMQDLDTFGDGTYSVATFVSADGNTIVGDAFNGNQTFPDTVAYSWTSAGGTVAVGGSPETGGTGTQWGSQGASSDGSVIVGNRGVSSMAAFRWTSAATINPMPAFQSSAQAVSADGNIVVGYYSPDPFSGQVGFIWTNGATPSAMDIPDLPGGSNNARAFAVSADGQRVVGEGTSAAGMEAITWDAQHGTRSLRDVLIAMGVADASSWSLSSATGISADGQTVVGWGTNPGGQIRGWLVSYGCYANCDGSTGTPALNIVDFVCFLQKFATGDPYANCDGSTVPPVLTVQDITCFMQRFASGCMGGP